MRFPAEQQRGCPSAAPIGKLKIECVGMGPLSGQVGLYVVICWITVKRCRGCRVDIHFHLHSSYFDRRATASGSQIYLLCNLHQPLLCAANISRDSAVYHFKAIVVLGV